MSLRWVEARRAGCDEPVTPMECFQASSRHSDGQTGMVIIPVKYFGNAVTPGPGVRYSGIEEPFDAAAQFDRLTGKAAGGMADLFRRFHRGVRTLRNTLDIPGNFGGRHTLLLDGRRHARRNPTDRFHGLADLRDR